METIIAVVEIALLLGAIFYLVKDFIGLVNDAWNE